MTKSYELDMSGLPCPMPIVKLKKFLAEHSNEAVEISLKVTDKGALKDIPAFCRQQHLDCVLASEASGTLSFTVIKN